MKYLRYRDLKVEFRALLLIALVGLVLVGCQSRPAPEVHYYLLQPSGKALTRGVVHVSSIELPAYLKTANLMLSVSDYEIRPAQYHLWSEPLEDGIRRVLEAELGSQLKDLDREGPSVQVELDIETFHATESGEIVLSGSWRLRGEEAEGHSFSIESSLKADGYPAAVEAHVRVLSVLAKSIVGEL